MRDDWLMGALAAQDAYRGADYPWQGPPEPAPDPWQAGVQTAEAFRTPPQGPQQSQAQLPDYTLSGLSDLAQRGVGGTMGDIGRKWYEGAHKATEWVRAPTQLMRANPYPPGSEEAQWYDNANADLANEWAIKNAYYDVFNPLGKWEGRGAVTSGAGSRMIQPARERPMEGTAGAPVWEPVNPRGTLFNYRDLTMVPKDVPQVGLPRYEPPRGVSDRVQDLVANRDVRDKMLQVMQEGERGGGATFYGTAPLREAFVAELGKREGPAAFGRYMDYVAATSPRSKVTENARNASYYYGLEQRGEPMPEVGSRNPQPYGHMAQRLHQQNAATVAAEGWNVFKNPKPASFSQNLQGNWEPVTVDAHAFKLPAMLAQDPRFLSGAIKLEKGAPTINPSQMFERGELSMEDALRRPAFWTSKPNKNEYAAMENYYRDLAREYGVPPAVGQAAAWSGGGRITGLGSVSGDPFIRAVEDRAIITAAERGITPAEALSQMIRGKAPLLGLGGAAMGVLADQSNYDQGR